MAVNSLQTPVRTGHLAAAALASLLGLAWLACAAAAQAPADFYKGKTVKFVVGFGTGGGFDAYARFFAAPLGKALDATVVVENQPGAGGLIALNRVAVSPPDGLTMMIVDGTPAALGQLLGQDNVRYDLAKLGHLGMINSTRFMWLVAATSPVQSVADVIKAGTKVRFGSAGPIDGPAGSAGVACEALRISCQVIVGYKGSSDMILAMQRGELDANFLSDSTAANLVASKQARAIVALSRERSSLLPDVPTMFEAAKLDAEQAWWVDFRANLNDLGRILVTTAGVPADRLAFLQGAVKKVLTDAAMVAEGAKTGRPLDFQEPEIARKKAISVLEGMTPEQKERVRNVALKKYVQ